MTNPRPICTMPDCTTPQHARTWCIKHYARWQRSGDPAGIVPRNTASCDIEGCETMAKTRGMCGKHAERVRKFGDPHNQGAVIQGDVLARFWSKVDRRGDAECWPWTGTIDAYGYSQFRAGNGRRMPGHRFAYELAFEPIPPGMQVDHVHARGCRLRSCVNPAHLEVVTPAENLARRVYS